MEYKEWAQEYLHDLEIMKNLIEKLKSERTVIQCSKKRSLLEDRINCLYEMYVEARKTYRLLEARANGRQN